MRAVEVGGGALEGIAAQLLTAAHELDAAGGGAPTAVDAGPWTSMITSMMARLTTAAASVAEGVGSASQGVTGSAEAYDAADSSAHTTFTPGAR